jgi:hypothetical protein
MNTHAHSTVLAVWALESSASADDRPSVSYRAAWRDLSCSWRDLSCSGSGPEAYRRVVYPGRAPSESEWPDGDRLPAQGGTRAAERRATAYAEAPIGTIVITFEREVYQGKRGKCSVSYGVLSADETGEAVVVPCDHRTLRTRPVHEVTLPNGLKIEVPR